ncbi:MAG: LPP20 family lipoprotein [Bacteroidetes bacterium]|nr:LPP20 family lipoprotein [Bacteroidota bacterium]
MKKQIASILAILLLVGCASSPKRLVTPPSDEYTLYARGLSTDQLVEEEADAAAALNARNELAASIENHIKSLTKRAREQIGIGKDAELNSQFSQAIKQTVDQTLNFSTLYKSAETIKKRNAFRAEVIYKIDIGPVNKRIMENIKQRQNLYERFRTSELFKELEEEIEKEGS